MAEESFEERTEEPTPRRREEARKEGRVARSQDFTSALVLVAALGVLIVSGPLLMRALVDSMQRTIRSASVADLTMETTPLVLRRMGEEPLLVVVLIAFLTALAAILAGIIQVGVHFTPELLAPKWDRLNPLNALKRIFSGQSLMTLAVGLLKLAIIGGLAWSYLSAAAPTMPALPREPHMRLLPLLGEHIAALGMRIVPAFLLIGGLDFFYQWWSNEKKLRMTKQEMKEEMKRTEGDPLIRQRIRQIQRQRAMQRMMQEVPKATVVVTNPTHVAVALRYAPGEQAAPRVVAKGVRLVAERIKALAYRHGVPVVEEPPLARALFKTVEVGDEIPAAFYQALAEILAVLFRRARPTWAAESRPSAETAGGAGPRAAEIWRPAETVGVATVRKEGVE
jgi:flagellar biosynthetic protein FlhB